MSVIVDRLVKPFFTRRFLQFATVGASGVVVNLVFLSLFRHLDVHINAASALAIEVSLVSNFAINYAWTFRDRRDHAGGLLSQALRFHIVCLAGAVIQFCVFVACNIGWLYLVFEPAAIDAYHQTTQRGVERWLWHPLVEPPDVGNWVYLSQLVGIAGGTAWNYLLNFYWTWSERGNRVQSDSTETEASV